MKYHPDILYAKYHFVGHVGRHIKLKMCSEMVKKANKCKMCSINGFCRINEVLVLVFIAPAYSRVRYRSPNFRPSVRSSVRPSVRQHLRRSLPLMSKFLFSLR